MATQKSHLQRCEELMMAYHPIFKKNDLICQQLQSGEFVLVGYIQSLGRRGQFTFKSYWRMIQILDEATRILKKRN